MSMVVRVYRWMEEHSRRLAVISGVVFALLALLWLSITTRTAMYNAQINELEEKRLDHIDRINQYWRALGEESTPEKMTARAQALGFRAVAVEYVPSVSEPAVDAGAQSIAPQPTQP